MDRREFALAAGAVAVAALAPAARATDDGISAAARSLWRRATVLDCNLGPQISADTFPMGQADLDVARFMGYRNELALVVERTGAEGVVASGSGLTLTGTAKDGFAQGARVRAAVRPDDIVLVDAGAAAPNALDATVDSIEYGGRESLVDIVTAGGVRLHVRSPAAVRVGEPVRASVPVARLLVYREPVA